MLNFQYIKNYTSVEVYFFFFHSNIITSCGFSYMFETEVLIFVNYLQILIKQIE